MFRPLFWLPLSIILALTACDDDPKKTNNQTPGCGDGVAALDLGEACDGADLLGHTCRSLGQGFDGGVLGCAADCTFDTSGCLGCDDLCDFDGQTRCNAGGSGVETCGVVASGCLGWVNTDCPTAAPFCVEDEGAAACAEACTDACALDATRCNGDDTGVETCVTGPAGCTEWRATACGGDTPVCVADGDGARCTAILCADDCPAGETRCNGDDTGIETCVTGEDGCGSWVNAPCEPATPACDGAGGAPTCVAVNGAGESCDDARRVTVPFTTAGLDFTADFAVRDLAFSHVSCGGVDLPAGPDAVFELTLAAGEAVVFMQGGGLDGALFVQAPCAVNGPCLEVMDQRGAGGVEELLFQAPAAGVYFFIVASHHASPADPRYLIAAYHYEDPAEQSCGDGFDNDLDGLADCADPDCFGATGLCDTETACSDGLDNDADGAIDCFDTECAGISPCGAEDTEPRCTDGIDNDADGLTDCDDPGCGPSSFCPVVLLSESFGVWPPAGWTLYTEGDPNRVTWRSSAGTTHTLPGATGLFAVADSDYWQITTNHDDYLFTPQISCQGYTHFALEFLHTYRDYSGTDTATVGVTLDGGLYSWITLATYTADTADGVRERLDLTPACGGSFQAWIYFRYQATWDYHWLIDDVRVIAW
jgi:hypothetical protein